MTLIDPVTVNESEMTFGIEIEGLIDSTYSDIVGSYHNGRYIQYVDDLTCGRWTAEEDSSITPDDSYEYPCEIVSPILSGTDGLDDICKVVDFMIDEYDFKYNDSCGVHVHIGVTNITDNLHDIKKIAYYLANFENAFFAIGGEEGIYRLFVDDGFCQSIRPIMDSEGDQFFNRLQHADRYMSINFRNLFNSKGTVEFRLFAPTLNHNILRAYVMLCVGTVRKAVESRKLVQPRYMPHGNNPMHKLFYKELTRVLGLLGWVPGAYKKSPYGYMLPQSEMREIVRQLKAKAKEFDECVSYNGYALPEAL